MQQQISGIDLTPIQNKLVNHDKIMNDQENAISSIEKKNLHI